MAAGLTIDELRAKFEEILSKYYRASRVVIIDQAADDGFDNEGFAQRISYWPIIGQASDRLLHVAPKSAILDQYDDAFAPGYDIASGFDNPDQPVDDLRAMTYTAYKDTRDAEEDFVAEAPLDQRLATAGVPTMVIFGAEDQIYDAPAAIEPYRQNGSGRGRRLRADRCARRRNAAENSERARFLGPFLRTRFPVLH